MSNRKRFCYRFKLSVSLNPVMKPAPTTWTWKRQGRKPVKNQTKLNDFVKTAHRRRIRASHRETGAGREFLNAHTDQIALRAVDKQWQVERILLASSLTLKSRFLLFVLDLCNFLLSPSIVCCDHNMAPFGGGRFSSLHLWFNTRWNSYVKHLLGSRLGHVLSSPCF